MFARIAQWYLQRRGFHVVAPNACEMVLSGYWQATQDAAGNYLVEPPFPDAGIVARHCSFVKLNGIARGDEYKSFVDASPGGLGWTMTEHRLEPIQQTAQVGS